MTETNLYCSNCGNELNIEELEPLLSALSGEDKNSLCDECYNKLSKK